MIATKFLTETLKHVCIPLAKRFNLSMAEGAISSEQAYLRLTKKQVGTFVTGAFYKESKILETSINHGFSCETFNNPDTILISKNAWLMFFLEEITKRVDEISTAVQG